MAVYLFTVKTISRGKNGGNMLAAAAYRPGSRLVERAEWDPGSAIASAAHAAGAELADAATGRAWDFSRKPVEHSEIALPSDAPEWMTDRQALWSAVGHPFGSVAAMPVSGARSSSGCRASWTARRS